MALTTNDDDNPGDDSNNKEEDSDDKEDDSIEDDNEDNNEDNNNDIEEYDQVRPCYDFKRFRQSSTVVGSKVRGQMSLEECKS